MKKSLTIAVVAAFIVSASAGANAADDNKVVAGAKKVGTCIVWPFKKLGEGIKAVGSKLTGK